MAPKALIFLSTLVGMTAAHAVAAGDAHLRPPAALLGEARVTSYDGVTDDLATAGLGAAGLQGLPPAIDTPPTAAQLRRLAIYNNYRALVDVSPGGGFGTFYGPGVGGGPERIAGTEYLALARSGAGRQVITVAVQIPAGFDPERPCIVTGPSSGSRGVYGAIGTSGEWGLRKGCAVAYTDKGTGIGAHDLTRDQVYLVDGTPASAAAAGNGSSFTAPLSPAQRRAFAAAFPDRWAFEHAHSETNPEADWGRHVLTSLEVALWAINVEHGSGEGGRRRAFDWRNTLVIASSVSNGGGASIRAAELARHGVIDGIAVSEPNVSPRFDRRTVIQQGDGEPLARHSRRLYDYTTRINLLQGCANFGRSYAGAVLAPALAAIQPLAANRCQSLKEAGVLAAATVAEQADEAQGLINAYGILPEQNFLQPLHWLFSVPQAVAVTYANAYARASVRDNLCGYSFAATSPTAPFAPIPLAEAARAILFSTGNGIPPTGGVGIVNNLSPGGPAIDGLSVSPTFGRQDQNAEGAACLRSLATGRDEVADRPLRGPLAAARERLRRGIAEVTASGRLDGIPTLIVHGRADGVLPPNHTSRPYYALALRHGGRRAAIRYYEVLNAQHLDAFNAFPDLAARYVPLHHYFLQALDLLYAHLTDDAALPASQVVRAIPRGDAATPLAAANLPPIDGSPAAGDLIGFDGRTLTIPE